MGTTLTLEGAAVRQFELHKSSNTGPRIDHVCHPQRPAGNRRLRSCVRPRPDWSAATHSAALLTDFGSRTRTSLPLRRKRAKYLPAAPVAQLDRATAF